MRVQGAKILRPSLESLALLAALTLGAFAGMATATIAGRTGERAALLVALLVLVAVGGVIALTRKEPLSFGLTALIAAFPVASTLVPPGSLGVSVFDIAMLALMIGFLGKRLATRSAVGAWQFFPTRSMLIAWAFVIPCVVFSQFPATSTQVGLQMFVGTYGFFLCTLNEQRRERGFERLVLLLSIVAIVMTVGLFVDAFLRVNLSSRGSALNQLTYLGTTEIYRAGGFFQDPQKAAAFLAALVAFLLVLSIRSRFQGMAMRYVVWTAIVAACAGLTVTISRTAILSCLLVTVIALFAFNKWQAPAKIGVALSLVVVVGLVALTPGDVWLELAPTAVAERFLDLGASFERRFEIWFDTWDMFADHPLLGIGPSSFQEYLIETRPGAFNYYGNATAEGVVYIPDQPESGYLKILYEGGILGSAAALLVAGDAVRRAVAVAIDRSAPEHARTEAIAAIAGLLCVAATFASLFTFSDQRVGALLAFLFAVVWHRSLERTHVSA